MTWSIDARVPVRFGGIGDVGVGDAVLLEAAAAVPSGCAVERFGREEGHVAGCACCVARSPAAVALDRLFQRRARGETAFFRRVLAVTSTQEAEMEIWAALRTDPLASGRFRYEPGKS